MQASVVSVWYINQMHNGEAHAGEHILIKTRSVWEVCCSRDEAETGGSRDTDISAFAVSALRRVSARCRGREGGNPAEREVHRAARHTPVLLCESDRGRGNYSTTAALIHHSSSCCTPTRRRSLWVRCSRVLVTE